MNQTQKSILETYKGFLAQNIIWTDYLYSNLESYGLLMASMIDDIKEVHNKYEKTDRLIQWLFVREKKNFHPLCDVLQLSGHTFVSDFLREEEMSTEVIDTKALFEILPSLEKCLGQQQRTEVEHFIKQKVKELKFRGVWKEKTAEKEKFMEAKNLQLEQSHEFHVALKSKEMEISELKDEIESFDRERNRFGEEMRQLKKEFKEVQLRCNDEKGLQSRHNQANESSLRRLGKQLEIARNLLRITYQKITSILQLRPRSSDKEEIAIMDNEFVFFSDDFQKFLNKFQELEELQKEYESLKSERDWVLTHLGFNPQDENAPSLTQAYREFAVKTDDNMANLKQEVSIKRKVLREQEAKIQALTASGEHKNEENPSKITGCWQKFVFELLYRQLHFLQVENQEKNELIELISNENTILNQARRTAITSAGQIAKEYSKTVDRMYPDSDREEESDFNFHDRPKATSVEDSQVATSTKSENLPLVVQNVPILNSSHNQRPFSKNSNTRVPNTKTKNGQTLTDTSLSVGLTASSVKMVTRQNGRKKLV